jgi:purine-binding chemotaxis protein CheW
MKAKKMLNNKEKSLDMLVVYIEEHRFGLNVSKVRDILFEQDITPVPLAHPELMGIINLRGTIVTVLNMRKRLDLPDFPVLGKKTQIIVQYKDELFALVVDKVGEVIPLKVSHIEQTPVIVNEKWRKLMFGIVKQPNSILSLLDVDSVISLMLP